MDQTVQSADGMPVAGSFPPPTISGGAAPVTVVCTPASGATFPLGPTPVSCVATDALARKSSCGFSVTVRPPPRIRLTKYLAFGDSETEGKLSPMGFGLGNPGPSFSYPYKLKELLEKRYTAQTFVMSNEGYGGEVLAIGEIRLDQLLPAYAPEVLLIQEGINDLDAGGTAVIPAMMDSLRGMVEEGQRHGAVVFLATLLPQRAGPPKYLVPERIGPANDAIKRVAAEEQAILVDLYAAFGGSPDPLIGSDGLHPTEAGYEKMAEAFFSAIRASLEEPPVASGLGGVRQLAPTPKRQCFGLRCR
jgi:lysophospholipase L1-like esterase